MFLAVAGVGIAAASARPVHDVAAGSVARVAVVPAPGDRFAPDGTSVTFLNASSSDLSGLSVVGSRSGRHSGTISPLVGARGYEFTPAHPFAGGEVVTVRAPKLHVTGVTGAAYTFRTVVPVAPALARRGLAAVMATDDGTSSAAQHAQRARPLYTPPTCNGVTYVTAPTLPAPALCMNVGVTTSGVDPGTSLFLTPHGGGAGLYGNDGRLEWWIQGPQNEGTLDATEVQYKGVPYFALWQGLATSHGFGQVLLYNEHYQLSGVVQAGSDFGPNMIDLHEFQITPQGNALVGIYVPATVSGQAVFEYVVEEVSLVQTSAGIRTGSVLFRWESLNDVPTSQGMVPPPTGGSPWDYFHGNAISYDPSGGILVSGRNTWGIYEIDNNPADKTFEHEIWEVGGKGDSQLPEPWCYQHDIIGLGQHTYSLFDDGGIGPGCQHPARGLVFTVDPSTSPATVNEVASYVHNPPIDVMFTGSAQTLPNGDMLVDWGQVPEITEFSATGMVKMDLTMQYASYRGFRFPWVGAPLTPPSVVSKLANGNTDIWVSWNGATQVTSWRVLGGPSATDLAVIGKPRTDTGFETEMQASGAIGVIEVQGLSSTGAVLGTSKPVFTSGYLLASSSGAVAGVGQDAALGSAAPGGSPSPTVGIAKPSAGSGAGYFTAEANGAVLSHGTAGNFGSMAGKPLPAPIVGIAATPDGGGYWLLGRDGSVYNFGDAGAYGSESNRHLRTPFVSIASSPDGKGYLLTTAAGNVFNLGDATFHGSLAGKHLSAPIVAMAPSSDGGGYLLAGSDGGVFGFGDAPYHGGAIGTSIANHVVGIMPTIDNLGYWILGSTGQVVGRGQAAAYIPPQHVYPVVGLIALPGQT